jgi:pimeloyl-ACP methyl ester carboxylesterase
MASNQLHDYINETMLPKKIDDARLATLVMIPCFSGAPWELEKLKPLAHRPLKTMRLPEGVDDIEKYADFVEKQIANLDNFILVGDSFGAVISIALATRRPEGLSALIVSGGFASNPVSNPLLKLLFKAAGFLPGILYRTITLNFHASSLASPYDYNGEIPWSKKDSLTLFRQNTPHKSYFARTKAAFSANYVGKLNLINVPTLVITPSYDRLIGTQAAKQILDNIPDASEVVLANTGHMFRFTHPVTYAQTIERFLNEKVE